MARRRLTVKRIDPWSVLKFGFIANIVFLAIFLMLMGVVWFIVDRLQLVDQVCGIATDVGFTECGINAGNLFRSLILLGLLWVVVQTAVLVFLAFLYNLIADLTGGLGLTIVDDSLPPASSATSSVRHPNAAGLPPNGPRSHSPSTAASAGTAAGVGSTDDRRRSPTDPGPQDTTEAVPRPATSGSRDASTTAGVGRHQASDEELFGNR